MDDGRWLLAELPGGGATSYSLAELERMALENLKCQIRHADPKAKPPIKDWYWWINLLCLVFSGKDGSSDICQLTVMEPDGMPVEGWNTIRCGSWD